MGNSLSITIVRMNKAVLLIVSHKAIRTVIGIIHEEEVILIAGTAGIPDPLHLGGHPRVNINHAIIVDIKVNRTCACQEKTIFFVSSTG
jgi:hypothetical protein